MKVLLDENLPHKLRAHLAKHDTATVAHLGWGGLKNGELLDKAEAAGFDVFMTGDRRLEYQQNLAARKMAVVSLSANNWPIIKHHLTKIAGAVDTAAGRCAYAGRVRDVFARGSEAGGTLIGLSVLC